MSETPDLDDLVDTIDRGILLEPYIGDNNRRGAEAHAALRVLAAHAHAVVNALDEANRDIALLRGNISGYTAWRDNVCAALGIRPTWSSYGWEAANDIVRKLDAANKRIAELEAALRSTACSLECVLARRARALSIHSAARVSSDRSKKKGGG